ERARPVHPLDPDELDVARRARPRDPRERAGGVEDGDGLGDGGDDLLGAQHVRLVGGNELAQRRRGRGGGPPQRAQGAHPAEHAPLRQHQGGDVTRAEGDRAAGLPVVPAAAASSATTSPGPPNRCRRPTRRSPPRRAADPRRLRRVRATGLCPAVCVRTRGRRVSEGRLVPRAARPYLRVEVALDAHHEALAPLRREALDVLAAGYRSTGRTLLGLLSWAVVVTGAGALAALPWL